MESLWLLLFPALLFGFTAGIDLHFDNTDSGFFFQQSSVSSQSPLVRFPAAQHSSSFLNASTVGGYPDSKIMLKERLVVLRPSHPSKIQVIYGPFEAKQTLPAQFVIPIVNFPQDNLSLPFDNTDHTSMDITAHVVNSDLRRENPVLRVLFHSGKHFHSLVDEEGSDKKNAEEVWDEDQNAELMQTCIALKVQNPNGGSPLTSTCAPQGLDGVCLASVTLPYDWWITSSMSPTFPSLSTGPSLTGYQSTVKPSKAVRNIIELSYTVYETKAGQCVHPSSSTASSSSSNGEKWAKFRGHGHKNHQAHASNSNFPPHSAVLIQSPTLIGSLRLSPNVYAPRDLIPTEEAASIYPTLRFISSASPLYPKSQLYVTVLLDTGSQSTSKEEPYAVVVRVKVKNGLRIISTLASNSGWNLNFDVNGKHISASATIVRNFSVPAPNKSQELFTWLLAVNADSKDPSAESDGVRALWSWTIRSHMPYRSVHSGSSQSHHGKDGLDEVKGKFTTRFDVLKDEVQSVFPIIKRRELLNSAILTGRQVSEPLRVFMVTQGGKVADVTLQASCSSADESVLKVSSSCTSVYLDGSEVRGSTNATFTARYGNVESTSSVTVWVPELPLDIQVEDVKLNAVHGWKVPADRNQCRSRYQQSLYEVFARFYAEDHDSGRVSYFLSRKTYLLISELVRKVMRVQDPRVASLKTNYVEGMKAGKTELQVLSPMSGQVIGSREIRVVAEKIEMTNLSIQVISGLSLNIYPDQDLESCYVAEVDISEKLVSKYQEAILDLTLHFSDGSTLPLRHADRSHYNLVAESLNVTTLVLTSPVKSTILRVLALGEGKANVSVVMSTSDPCLEDGAQTRPLIASWVVVEVALKGSQVTSVQNDARTGAESTWPDATQSYTLPHTLASNQIIGEATTKRKMSADSGSRAQTGQGQLTFSKPGSTEFGDNQLSLKDDSNAVMVVGNSVLLPHSQAHPFHPYSSMHMSPLEIGMYVLLAVFCAAIVVFVGTCVVYASRARKGAVIDEDPTTVLPPTPPIRLEQLWTRFQKKKGPEEDNTGDGSEPQETSDKNWIWLGRSTLDNPSTGGNGSSRQRTACQGRNGRCADKELNRLSGISYSGSEVSVRITSRSRPQDGGRLTYTAELCFDDEAEDAGVATTGSNHSQHSQQQPKAVAASPNASIDSQTYTKKTPAGPIRIVTNPNFMAAPVHQKKSGRLNCSSSVPSACVDPDGDADADVEDDNTEEPLLTNVIRRPKSIRQGNRLSEQDTRRYARSWLMAGEAVPRDFNSNSSALDEEEATADANSNVAPADGTSEQFLATFIRKGSPDIKKANIVENPRFAAKTSSSPTPSHQNGDQSSAAVDAEASAATTAVDNGIAVDYERIISYLGILKETSA